MSIDLILYIAAAICFALAALNIKVGSVQLVPLGLFCWVLTAIIS